MSRRSGRGSPRNGNIVSEKFAPRSPSTVIPFETSHIVVHSGWPVTSAE